MPTSPLRRLLYALADTSPPDRELTAHRFPLLGALADLSPASEPREFADSYVARAPRPARRRTGSHRWGKGLVAALSAATLTILGAGFFALNGVQPSLSTSGLSGSAAIDHAEPDPCGLLDTAALDALGRTELDNTTGPFDRCTATLMDRDHRVTTIGLTLLVGQPDREAARTGGAWTCERTTPPDEVSARISVVGQAADRCRLAETLATHAAAVLRQGRLPTRTSHPPGLSLIDADACRLLSGAPAGTLSGPPQPGFGNWSCQWPGESGSTVTVRFDRIDQPPTGTPLPPGSGHPRFVTGENGERWCAVQVVFRSYPLSRGGTIVELIHVAVSAPKPGTKPCDTAATLSTAVTDVLPPG
ncbi:hypothetical protein ACIA5G_50810 [Amycolatopsis sp. NPDC051758]|uniref:hypothetical protein n=1 Tax=Amycolatopsis sp. NPDC051758 TaxID=3363935 RepID=UPI00379599E1